MKIKLTLLFLFAALSSHAKFIQATIKFNDGHSENGFVKSFLEDKFIDLGEFQKLETSLNMNDSSLKFKSSEKGEIRTIGIDEVDELTLTYKNGGTETFKVLYLKTFSSDGKIKDSKYKMWFPLIKKGKINVYGYRYTETTPNHATGGMSTSREYIYYFQNSKKDYAMNPMGNVTLMSAMNGGAQKTFENCFKDLLSDCPEYYVKGVEAASSQNKMTSYREWKKEMKEREKAVKGQNLSPSHAYYEIYYHQFSELFADYEKNCPN